MLKDGEAVGQAPGLDDLARRDWGRLAMLLADDDVHRRRALRPVPNAAMIGRLRQRLRGRSRSVASD